MKRKKMIQTFNSHLCHVSLLRSCEIGIDVTRTSLDIDCKEKNFLRTGYAILFDQL